MPTKIVVLTSEEGMGFHCLSSQGSRAAVMVNQGLIVESRFSVRKEIVSDFVSSTLVSNVTEAQSLSDGLELLKKSEIDACILGPSLDLSVSEEFLRRSNLVLQNRSCAFVKISNHHLPDFARERLHRVGLHGELARPYSLHSFTELVESAIGKAKSDREAWAISSLSSSLQSLASAQRDLRKIADLPTLSTVVGQLSAKLQSLSQHLVSGSFKLQQDGTPSLATRDAIRIAFEMALKNVRPEGEEWAESDSQFVTALVQWFADRTVSSQQISTTRLRQNLLTLAKTPHS